MKQQTFIVKLLDINNNIVTFERFTDKRINTVKQKIKNLYDKNNGYYFLYEEDIKKSSFVVFYNGKDNERQIEIERYNVNDFLKMEV